MTSFLSDNQLYELWVLLRRGSHIILRARNKELRQYGISSVEAAVLQVVHNAGSKATPTGVSREILREPHSVSHLVTKMEKKGLLNKLKDLDRTNVARLELTAKGREAYYKSMKLESIRRIMSSLSEEEFQQLRSSLLKIRNNAVLELTNQKEVLYPLLS